MKQSILVGVVVLISTLLYSVPVCADQILYVAQQPSTGVTTKVAITEFTASGPIGTLATLDTPSSLGTGVTFMAVDPAGNLFANLNSESTIKEITPTGVVSTFSEMDYAVGGLTFDGHGTLFASRANDTILKFAADGSFSVYANLLPSNGVPEQIAGLALDRVGNLFVASRTAKSIIEVKPDGTSSTFASGLNAPFEVAFNSAGDLFVADQGKGIEKVTPDGTVSLFASIPDLYPATLAIGQDGSLYTANFSSVLKVTPDGTVSNYATGLNSPVGLAFRSIPEPPTFMMLSTGALIALGCASRTWQKREEAETF